MPGISDTQISWFQNIVLLGLGIRKDEFAYMLESGPMIPANDDGQPVAPCATDLLREFLEASIGQRTPIFFYTESNSMGESQQDNQDTEPILRASDSGRRMSVPGTDREGQTSVDKNGLSSLEQPRTDYSAYVGSVPKTPVLALQHNTEPECVGVDLDVQSIPMMVTKAQTVRHSTALPKRCCCIARGSLPESAQRAIYFVRNISGEVVEPLCYIDDVVLTIEHGCFPGDCLTNLSAAIKEVFLPLLDYQLGLGVLGASVSAGDKVSGNMSAIAQDALKVGDSLRSEFRANMHKFESQVSHTMHQVKGDVHLSIPNINMDDPEIGNDFEAVSMLEAAMEDWSRLIASVVEAESPKRVKGRGPLAEIEFWRRRNASLRTLYEQINMPKVRSMCCPI